MPSEPRRHREPDDLADRFALGVTRLLRFLADTFFARRYGHRAIVLETVAAVPGMVGAMATHLQCLRRLVDDDGWIRKLMEEAVLSYTQYLAEIEAGRTANIAAPAIARRYWKLADDATLRDVVLVVRADEAHHRDVNHGLANQLAGQPADPAPVAPYPDHADSTR